VRKRFVRLLLMPTIRAAIPSDGAAIRDMLTAAALPTADLSASAVEFLVAETDGVLMGVVGLEPHAPSGLLRSLVVLPQARGLGVGAALVSALEQHACSRGLTRLVLLTETAEEFFTRLGYVSAERASMPPDILATAEFRSLCPSSAACLFRDIPSS